MVTSDEQRLLLDLARRALEAKVTARGLPDPQPRCACVAAAAFVTIRSRGELRGCLGRLECTEPLWHVIRDLAEAVVDQDPRFAPVRRDELGDIHLEISVLTPPFEIRSPHEIRVGRHGLIVEQARRRGLLLPQVAAEHQWDGITFLEHTCVKAGLSRDAWQRGARIYTFEAQIFTE